MSEAQHLIADIPQKAFIFSGKRILFSIDKKGLYEPIGGRLNIDEYPHEGVKREVMEEIGGEIEIERIFDTFVFKSDNGVSHYVVIYLCRLLTKFDELKMNEDELSGLFWVDKENYLALPMREGYRRALLRFFENNFDL